MKRTQIIVTILMLVVVFLPAVIFASEFQPIVPIPGVTPEMTFGAYVNQIFKLVISLSAILAVLVIIYGGFEYMTASAGITKKNGSERIQGAVTGLILLLSVTLILQVINPCILEITVLSGATPQTSPSECSRVPAENPADAAERARAEREARIAREAQNPTDPFASGEADQSGRRRVTLRGMCLPGERTPIIPCTGAIPVCKLANGNLYEKREACQTGETETVVCPYGCEERRTVISLSPPPTGYDIGLPAGVCESRAGGGTDKTYCCKSARANCVEKTAGAACALDGGREQVSVCIPGAARTTSSVTSLQEILRTRTGNEGSCTSASPAGASLATTVCCTNSAKTDCVVNTTGVACVAPRAAQTSVCISRN